jgi:hypothetical protein
LLNRVAEGGGAFRRSDRVRSSWGFLHAASIADAKGKLQQALEAL